MAAVSRFLQYTKETTKAFAVDELREFLVQQHVISDDIATMFKGRHAFCCYQCNIYRANIVS